jgi:hypothetical protein
MEHIAVCSKCEDRNDPFSVPWDEIGAALMTAHMRDEHGYDFNPSTGTGRKIHMGNSSQVQE